MARKTNSKYAFEIVFYISGALFLFYALTLGSLDDQFVSFFIPMGVICLVIGAFATFFRVYITTDSKYHEDKKFVKIKIPPKTYTQNDSVINPDLFFTEKLSDDLYKDVIYRLKSNALGRTKTTYTESSSCEYCMDSLSFDSETRNTSIVFTKITKYRTIVRYVQENYERRPIYSDLKSKEKKIKKSVKLTNNTLENLFCYNDDEGIIRRFADLIILKLGKPEYFPSWIIRAWIRYEYDSDEKRINGITNLKISSSYTKIEQIKTLQEQLKKEKKVKEKERDDAERKIEKLEKSLKRAFILKKLKTKSFEKWKSIYQATTIALEDVEKEIAKADSDLTSEQNRIAGFEEEKKRILNSMSQKRKLLESQIRALSDDIYSAKKDDFLPLKTLPGIEYTKIVGVYVIRNTENEKCYVGQSKDVMRRLRQHFHGTVPNNVIFAEDYYSSKKYDKADLFEFKIIPLNTKDALDKTERDLIKKYNAREEGYNRTQGNA